MKLKVPTQEKWQIVDITSQIEQNLPKQSGLLNVFSAHTTAAITTADLDPGTDKDLLDFLKSLIPNLKWRHPHDPSHAPDHLLSSVIGPSVSVPVSHGKLNLGSWQRIILVELDGPRQRTVDVSFAIIKG
jgi:secondary thiamine-phosphate synthase enzyme